MEGDWLPQVPEDEHHDDAGDDGNTLRRFGGLEKQGGAHHAHVLLSSGKGCYEVGRK